MGRVVGKPENARYASPEMAKLVGNFSELLQGRDPAKEMLALKRAAEMEGSLLSNVTQDRKMQAMKVLAENPEWQEQLRNMVSRNKDNSNFEDTFDLGPALGSFFAYNPKYADSFSGLKSLVTAGPAAKAIEDKTQAMVDLLKSKGGVQGAKKDRIKQQIVADELLSGANIDLLKEKTNLTGEKINEIAARILRDDKIGEANINLLEEKGKTEEQKRVKIGSQIKYLDSKTENEAKTTVAQIAKLAKDLKLKDAEISLLISKENLQETLGKQELEILLARKGLLTEQVASEISNKERSILESEAKIRQIDAKTATIPEESAAKIKKLGKEAGLTEEQIKFWTVKRTGLITFNKDKHLLNKQQLENLELKGVLTEEETNKIIAQQNEIISRTTNQEQLTDAKLNEFTASLGLTETKTKKVKAEIRQITDKTLLNRQLGEADLLLKDSLNNQIQTKTLAISQESNAAIKSAEQKRLNDLMESQKKLEQIEAGIHLTNAKEAKEKANLDAIVNKSASELKKSEEEIKNIITEGELTATKKLSIIELQGLNRIIKEMKVKKLEAETGVATSKKWYWDKKAEGAGSPYQIEVQKLKNRGSIEKILTQGVPKFNEQKVTVALKGSGFLFFQDTVDVDAYQYRLLAGEMYKRKDEHWSEKQFSNATALFVQRLGVSFETADKLVRDLHSAMKRKAN